MQNKSRTTPPSHLHQAWTLDHRLQPSDLKWPPHSAGQRQPGRPFRTELRVSRLCSKAQWLRIHCFREVSPQSHHPVLLLLLSHVSRVRLCETSETAAHQAPPSLGFSRQEHWSGLPFPSPTRESEVAQSCPTLRDPVDCSDSPSIRSLFGTLCYSPRSSVCPGTTPGANAHLKRPVRWPFCLEHSLPK